MIIASIFNNYNCWMPKQPIVCLTGFTNDPKLPQYIKMLEDINCKFIKQLLMGVDYLLVRNTCTEKFKIAELGKSAVQCITLDWLLESFEKNRILPIQKYRVPNIFYGIRIGIYGFSQSQASKILALLKNNGAQLALNVKINNGKIDESVKSGKQEETLTISLLESLDVIVSTPRQLLKLNDILPHTPVVNLDWIQQSCKKKHCKYPVDYAMNFCKLKGPPSNSEYKRLMKKLKSFMDLSLIQNTPYSNITNFLAEESSLVSQCIVYFDKNTIDPELLILLKKIVSVTGGIYLDIFTSCITHVLVGPIAEKQYIAFLKNGDSVHILRVQWFVDSILFAERLPETDYKVRGFKILQSPTNPYYDQSMGLFSQSNNNLLRNNSQNSFGFHSTPFQFFQNRRSGNSISLSAKQVMPVKKQISKTKTNIFKGLYFYLDKKQRKQEICMINIIRKITENGGIPLEVLPPTNMTVFVILADSSQNVKILENLAHNKQMDLIPMSTRWIEYCIKKTELIDYRKGKQNNFFIFQPFLFETPLRMFATMKIQLLGINEKLRIRYRELVSCFGSCKVSPNKAEITHCLCGEDYKNTFRFVQLRKQNKNIIYVKAQWLIDLTNDCTTQIDDYILENKCSQNSLTNQ